MGNAHCRGFQCLQIKLQTSEQTSPSSKLSRQSVSTVCFSQTGDIVPQKSGVNKVQIKLSLGTTTGLPFLLTKKGYFLYVLDYRSRFRSRTYLVLLLTLTKVWQIRKSLGSTYRLENMDGEI